MCLDEWNPALDASLFLYSATSWYFADFIVKKSLFKGRNPRTRVVDRSRRTRWHINGMTGNGDKCERAGWVSEATLMDTRSWDETTIRETLLNGDVTMHSVLELLLSLFQSYRRHHRPYLSLSLTHMHSPGAAQNPQSAIIYWFTTHRRPLVIQRVSLSAVCLRGESCKKCHFSQCRLFCCFIGSWFLKCHYTQSENKSELLRILRSWGLAYGSSVD